LASIIRTIPITRIKLKFDIGANFHFFATQFRKGTSVTSGSLLHKFCALDMALNTSHSYNSKWILQ
jgi:hypothetical protein